MKYLSYEISQEIQRIRAQGGPSEAYRIELNQAAEALLIEELQAISQLKIAAGSLQTLRGVIVQVVPMISDTIPMAKIQYFDNGRRVHSTIHLEYDTVEKSVKVIK